jgi:hypothetical protein
MYVLRLVTAIIEPIIKFYLEISKNILMLGKESCTEFYYFEYIVVCTVICFYYTSYSSLWKQNMESNLSSKNGKQSLSVVVFL